MAGVTMATDDKAGELVGSAGGVPRARPPVSCSSLWFKGQLLVNAVCEWVSLYSLHIEHQNNADFTSKARTFGLVFKVKTWFLG